MSQMWCLVDKKTGASSAPIRLNTAFKIGRPTPSGSEAGIDIAIKGDSSISRLHAEILIKKLDEESPPHMVVTDHSKFGIFVNGEKIDGFKTLKENDEITFGVYGSCFTLESVKPKTVKKDAGTSQLLGSSVSATLKPKPGSPTQAPSTSCVYRKGKPPKDAIRVKIESEQVDHFVESQIKIKVKTEPLVVKNYQDLQNSCVSEMGTIGSTNGRLNFKKFKKVPKASALKQMSNGAAAARSSVATTTAPSLASNSRLRQKKPKLETSQFVSFKNEPFDVDSQFLSFMSQNR